MPAAIGEHHLYPAADLRSFAARAFQAVGVPADQADTIAKLMTDIDLRGADGHGIFRLPQYIRRIRAGGINVSPNIRVVRETAAAALGPVDSYRSQMMAPTRNSMAM